MTSTLHIVVAMKPLDGNFANNAIKHGVAGLNIDACRISGPKGSGVWGTSNKTINNDRKFNASPKMGDYRSEQHTAGRFPSNVILAHKDGCRQVGVKKIRGSVSIPSGFDRLNKKQAEMGYRPGEYQKGKVAPGYQHTDVDGKETVEQWECAPGCPVNMMGKQSGISRSTGGKGVGSALVDNPGIYGKFSGENKGVSAGGFGDTGSAARFFKQIKEE